MPVHDWTRVEAGLFHDFHHEWISTLKGTLNNALLPPDYYALADQVAGGFGPDVLTLQGGPELSGFSETNGSGQEATGSGGTATATAVLVAPPMSLPSDQMDLFSGRRRGNRIVVRHVSGDRVVAVIEIISPGNKSSPNPLRSFVEKAITFLEREVHLLILDLFPPGENDPQGIHAAIWEAVTDESPQALPTKPLTLASYEAAGLVRAYVKYVAVGESLPEVPLFLRPNGQIPLPLESAYERAYANVPRRIRERLERPAE